MTKRKTTRTLKLLVTTIGTCDDCRHRSNDWAIGSRCYCEADYPAREIGIVRCAKTPIPEWCLLDDEEQAGALPCERVRRRRRRGRHDVQGPA